MQVLNRLLATIQLQLKGLPLNAKLLIGSLMIILVMSLFLVSLYAGRMTMVPLNLPADMSEEAKANAISFLQIHQIPYEERAGDIVVPAEQRTIVLARMIDNNVLNADEINFDKLLSDDSPFRSHSQNDRRYLIAKMNELSGMIRQFRGIDKANVVIDESESGIGIGRSHIPPSASVTVTTSGKSLTQEKAESIANLVASAHAGLKVQNVKVTDTTTGKHYVVRSEDALRSTKNLEAKLAAEKHVRKTLKDALAYIPGVRVNVNAQVDTREIVQQSTNYEDPVLGVTEESSRAFNSTRQSSVAEPGVRSNTGATITGGGAGGESVSDERASTSTIPAFSKSTSRIVDPKGQILMINAAIGVPRSYIVNLYKALHPSDPDTEPNETEFNQIVLDETTAIREYIRPLIDTRAVAGAVTGTITVRMFHDMSITGAGGMGGPGGIGSGGEPTDLLARIGVSESVVKFIGLGGLAIISLAMMLLMVRRATMHEDLPSPEEMIGIPPTLTDSESDLIGEAGESLPALEGVEIDEKSIRRQEMLDQITSLVNDSPDEAAHLMQKWMQDSGR
ncbi:MAG: hypothetical protein IH891_00520 [Planctomycetes bacterium]|nr:hypothetical protein [Planctomycetota bacterium]